MSARLIFESDGDETVTYFLDSFPHMPERDLYICRALMDMVISHMDYPRMVATEGATS